MSHTRPKSSTIRINDDDIQLDEKLFEERRKKWNVVDPIPRVKNGFPSKDVNGEDVVSNPMWTKMGNKRKSIFVENVQLCPAKPKLDGTVFKDNVAATPTDNADYIEADSSSFNESHHKRRDRNHNTWAISGTQKTWVPCGLCEYKFPRENLTGVVSLKSIFNKRVSWGVDISTTKTKWNCAFMYSSVKICGFCTQLFQPVLKNVVYPDPPCIFNIKSNLTTKAIIDKELEKQAKPHTRRNIEHTIDRPTYKLEKLLDMRRRELGLIDNKHKRPQSAFPLKKAPDIPLKAQINKAVELPEIDQGPRPWWVRDNAAQSTTRTSIINRGSVDDDDEFLPLQITIPTSLNSICTPKVKDSLRDSILKVRGHLNAIKKPSNIAIP